jgi:hypothetical protein
MQLRGHNRSIMRGRKPPSSRLTARVGSIPIARSILRLSRTTLGQLAQASDVTVCAELDHLQPIPESHP